MWWEKSGIIENQEVTAITFLNKVFVDKNMVKQDWASFNVLVGQNDRATGLPTQTVRLDSSSNYSELRTLCVHAIGTAVDYLLTTEADMRSVIRTLDFGDVNSSEDSDSAANVQSAPFPNQQQPSSYRPSFTTLEQENYPLFRQDTHDGGIDELVSGIRSMDTGAAREPRTVTPGSAARTQGMPAATPTQPASLQGPPGGGVENSVLEAIDNTIGDLSNIISKNAPSVAWRSATSESYSSSDTESEAPVSSASAVPQPYSVLPQILRSDAIRARQSLQKARSLLTVKKPHPVYSLANLSFKSILPPPDEFRYQARQYDFNVGMAVSIRECYAIGAYLRIGIDWQDWSKQTYNIRRKLMLPQQKDNASGALINSRVQTAYAYVNKLDALEIVVWTVVRPDTMYSIVASPHLEWSTDLAKHKAELLVSAYDDRLLHKGVHIMRLVASRTHTFRVIDGTFSTMSRDPLQCFLMTPRLVRAIHKLCFIQQGVGAQLDNKEITATSLEKGTLSAVYRIVSGRSASTNEVFDYLADAEYESSDVSLIDDEKMAHATGMTHQEIEQYTKQKLSCYTFGNALLETTAKSSQYYDYTDVSSVFRGTTTLDAEYRKYCNPSAEEISPGDVMSAAIDSAKLLCLTQVIEKHSASTRAHFTRRMLSRAHQMIGSRETDDIMRFMRSMQIGDEFDRYFNIPTLRSSVSLLRTNFNIMTSSMSDLSSTLYKFSECLPVAR